MKDDKINGSRAIPMLPNAGSIEVENIQLKQTITSLQDQLNTLKGQFDEAIPSTAEIQKVHEDNMKITKELRRSIDEKDDLSRRLQIASQKIKELTDQNKILQNNAIQKEICQQKSTYDSEENKKIIDEIARLQGLLKGKDESIIRFDSVINNYQNQLDQLYTAASQYFSETITDFDTLLHYLLSPPKIEKKENPSESLTIIKTPKKTDKWKTKYSQLIQYQDKIEQMFLNKLEKTRTKYETQIRNLNFKIEQSEINLQNARNEIEENAKENQDLHKQIAKYKTKARLVEQQADTKHLEEKMELSQKVENLSKLLSAEKESSESLKKNLKVAIKKAKAASDDKTRIDNELILFKTKSISLEADKERLEKRINQLETQLNDAEAELRNTSRKCDDLSLGDKRKESLINSLRTEQEKSKAVIEHFTKTVEELRSEIRSLEEDRENISKQLEIQLQSNKENEIKIMEMNKKLTISNKEILELKKDLEAAEFKADESDLIPLAAWSAPNFPRELAEIVGDLAKNPTLKTPTKLRQILSTIGDWFAKRTERIEAELNNEKQKNNETAEMLKQISVDFSKLFECSELDQIFSSSSKKEEFIQRINNQKKEFKETKMAKERLENSFLDIVTITDSETIEDATEAVKTLQKDLETLSIKCQSLMTVRKRLKHDFAKREEELINELESIEYENENLKKEIKKAYEMMDVMKKEIENEKRASEILKDEYEEKIGIMNATDEGKINEYEKSTQSLLDKINEEKKLNEKLEAALKKSKFDLEKCQRTVMMATQSQKKALSECEEMRQRIKITEAQCADRIKKEREIAYEKYGRLNEQLTAANEELKGDNEHLKGRLEESERSRKASVDALNELSLKLQRSVLTEGALRADAERSRRIFESQLRAKTVAIESDCASKIQQARADADESKRAMMGSVVMNFASLFNVSDSLDESNFEVFLENIGKTLSGLMRLESKLRELLSLGPTQSIVDEVSLLVLNR